VSLQHIFIANPNSNTTVSLLSNALDMLTLQVWYCPDKGKQRAAFCTLRILSISQSNRDLLKDSVAIPAVWFFQGLRGGGGYFSFSLLQELCSNVSSPKAAELLSGSCSLQEINVRS
jgi:hypothetical protein